MAAGVLNLPTLIQRVRVDSDTRGAETQTKGALDRIGTSVTKVGVGLSAGVTLPILALAKSSVTAASDLAESMSKVDVVFGENAAQIQKWSDSTARSLGISKQAALEAAGTFGNLFSALGIATGPAADMSVKLVQLAADLASFNNENPEDVLLALRSGLVGEAEPLRKFGVNLSQARIEAEALSSGLVKGVTATEKVTRATINVEKAIAATAKAEKEHGKTSLEYRDAAAKVADAQAKLAEATKGTVPELTGAQKAQAAYAVILKDTSLAQGDFERTSGGLANQQRIASAQWDDAKAKLGKGLLPVMVSAATAVNGLLTAFNALPEGGQKTVLMLLGIAAAVGPVLIGLGKLTSGVGTTIGILGKVPGAAANFATGVGHAVAATARLVVALIQLGVQLVVAAARMTVNAAIASAQFVASMIRAGASAAVQGAIMVASFLATAAAAVASAAAVVAAWIVAAAPFILLGLVIAAVVIAVIKNWDTIKAATVAVWNGIVDTVKGAGSAIWGAIQGVIGFFVKLKDGIVNAIEGAIDWIARNVGRLIAPIKGALGFLEKVPGLGGVISAIPGFAEGGRAPEGQWRWVGERGPELERSNSNATIVSNEQIRRALAVGPTGGGGSVDYGDVIVHLTVKEMVVRDDSDIRAVSRELHDLIERSARAKGKRRVAGTVS